MLPPVPSSSQAYQALVQATRKKHARDISLNESECNERMLSEKSHRKLLNMLFILSVGAALW